MALIRVGSRGSRLALTQAELAGNALRAAAGSPVEIALVPITTAGDRDRTKPFGEIGTRGVFVKELEEALLAGRIDVAVHSAKDMTSTDATGLAVGAYLPREDPRDALCGADAVRPGMRIGTASVRRRAQLLALEPGLQIEQVRDLSHEIGLVLGDRPVGGHQPPHHLGEHHLLAEVVVQRDQSSELEMVDGARVLPLREREQLSNLVGRGGEVAHERGLAVRPLHGRYFTTCQASPAAHAARKTAIASI